MIGVISLSNQTNYENDIYAKISHKPQWQLYMTLFVPKLNSACAIKSDITLYWIGQNH